MFLCAQYSAHGESNVSARTKAPLPVAPAYHAVVNTLTPVFRWQQRSDFIEEYRLVVAEKNGKILLDEWVSGAAEYHVQNGNLLKDLEIYYWNVSAYDGSEYYESKTYSFWVDLNRTLDLEIRDVKVITDPSLWRAGQKLDVEIVVVNAGDTESSNTKILLYNGNANRNYMEKDAIRKSVVVDSVIIPLLANEEVYKATLSCRLMEGLNHLYAEVRADDEFSDRLLFNNFSAGPAIQASRKILKLQGLVLIYDKYIDEDNVLHQLEEDDLKKIYDNLLDTEDFIWQHTLALELTFDTLLIRSSLNADDFTYIDKKWGYILTPEDIQYDLAQGNRLTRQYDFIYAFYAWNNSQSMWSGYHGYTYGAVSDISGINAFSAQPVVPRQLGTEEVTIHEILRLLDDFYAEQDVDGFHAPDAREKYTTFPDNKSYYQWMLETWPTERWFALDRGQKIFPPVLATGNRGYEIPENSVLFQNYPNPFNSSTVISYSLSEDMQNVSLVIYSLLGERVRDLVNASQKSGFHSIGWDGKNNSGEMVSSGIYLYRLKMGNQSLMKKLLFIK
jgi:hypothetical protein